MLMGRAQRTQQTMQGMPPSDLRNRLSEGRSGNFGWGHGSRKPRHQVSPCLQACVLASCYRPARCSTSSLKVNPTLIAPAKFTRNPADGSAGRLPMVWRKVRSLHSLPAEWLNLLSVGDGLGIGYLPPEQGSIDSGDNGDQHHANFCSY